jgi:hypothetical protein
MKWMQREETHIVSVATLVTTGMTVLSIIVRVMVEMVTVSVIVGLRNDVQNALALY